MPILDELRSLSTAEDFFGCLDLPFDGAVLDVARLHILRRMGQYLRETDLTGLDDAHARECCRGHLAKAYADFRTSSPLEQRIFKVLKEAGKPPAKAFVPLSALGGVTTTG